MTDSPTQLAAEHEHRLEGLEPDNLLAFLALLGLLRALEASDRQRPDTAKLRPRAAWDVDTPPLRPRLYLSLDKTREEISERADEGVDALSMAHDFGGRRDLNYKRTECRSILEEGSETARQDRRSQVDLLAALMSDAAIKDGKDEVIDPTPLCLLFGQGHQHFLERLASAPREGAPPRRGRGKSAITLTPSQCLREALFESWRREDDTASFRWDPEEDVRYALMAGDPTDTAYKSGTQHGANRLAAIGMGVLTLAPQSRGGRVRPDVVGGAFDRRGFSFAWPIWRAPATLTAISALVAHPSLRKPDALAHLGVDQVLVARRISVGKFMNVTRARPVQGDWAHPRDATGAH